MRWAFWRRRRPVAAVEPAPAAPAAPAAPPAGRSTSPAGWRDDEPRRTPAFSGASPQPAAGPLDPLDALRTDAPGGAGLVSDDDLEAVRADLVALVRAVQLGDRDDVEQLRGRVAGYADGPAALVFLGALAVLGERYLLAAGVPPERGEPGSAGTHSAAAEGDRSAARAQPVVAELVPAAAVGLLPYLVRYALGVPELAEEPQEPLEDADTVLVLAVLLAQTCTDGHGTPEQAGDRLLELFGA